MNDQIQVNIVQRVKEFLKIEEECSATDLYTRLQEYIKQVHPDRFTNRDAKKDAEEKFKTAQELKNGLYKHIEIEASKKTSTDLVLYKPTYDYIFTQEALDKAKEEIDELKSSLKLRNFRIERLEEEIDNLKTQKFDEERKRLEELYKPRVRNWAPVGVLLLLSTIIAVMTKVDEVSAILMKYSPINESTLRISVFVIFLIILVLMIRRMVENNLMKQRVREVCSSKVQADFIKYLSNKSAPDEPDSFTEHQVFEFIKGHNSTWKMILSFFGFVHFKTENVDQIKSFFIENLLRKELISISNAENLDRRFTIRGTKKDRSDWDY